MPRSHSLSGLRGEGTHLTSLIGAVSEGVNLRSSCWYPAFVSQTACLALAQEGSEETGMLGGIAGRTRLIILPVWHR